MIKIIKIKKKYFMLPSPTDLIKKTFKKKV